ncbi:pyocin knob domain-containing protein [Lactococcus petauri]|uniref:pyocin knob domain-containing protein n=1 Tax=Lactococcus petauri TaxID=1940789 RepID=UPI003D6EA7BF
MGLSNVSNYGIATEAEATAGTSNAKYMTPSLTKKAAKSYVDKTDVGLSNVDNVKQASKSEFDDHTANKTNPHGVTAAQVGAYTKSETDAKFKVINDLIISQDIPEGANLDDYKKEGEFSKKTPTVVTGAPEGVTGAFRLTVRSMVGSSGIFQTLYDYATRAIYYRIGNTTLGFNLTWQRIANNSEVVHLAGDETIAGKKTFTDETTVSKLKAADIEVTKSHAASSSIYNGNGLINFSRAGNMVQVSVRSMPSIPINTRITGVIPTGYRPLNDYVSITKPSKNFYFYPNGDVGTGSDALTSADGYYSFCYPTADAAPTD